MQDKIESMTDMIIEHICHHDNLFNTTAKMFIFTNIEDYFQFEYEQRSSTPNIIHAPITIMDTLIVYSKIKECNPNLAWGSLNFKAAEIPTRFICGYQFININTPIVIGLEITHKSELVYRKCELSNYQGLLNRS